MIISLSNTNNEYLDHFLSHLNQNIEAFLKFHGDEQGSQIDQSTPQDILNIFHQINFQDYHISTICTDKSIINSFQRNMHDLTSWVVENGLGSTEVGTVLKTSIIGLANILEDDFDQDALSELFNIDRLYTEVDNLNTALTLAIRAENVDRVAWLLKLGARVDIGDRTGLSPLQIAASLGNVALIEMLLNSGADFDWPPDWIVIPEDKIRKSLPPPLNEERFDTPLKIAISHKQHDAVEFLTMKGAWIMQHPHVWEQIAKDKTLNPTAADCDKIARNSICREFFAAKLLSHSLKFKGNLIFQGGNLNLEGSHSPWFCWEMRETLQEFSKFYPNKLETKEIMLLQSFLESGGQNYDAEKNYSQILETIKHSSSAGPLVAIHAGFPGHTAEWIFYDDYLMIANKGAASRKIVEIFKIDKNELNEKVIEAIFSIKKKEESYYSTYIQLLPITMNAESNELTNLIEDSYPIQELGITQGGGFCTWTSVETGIFCTLAMARFAKNYPSILPSSEAIKEIQDTFILWLRFTQLYEIEKYFNQVDRGEIPFNMQLAILAFNEIKDIDWPPIMQEQIERLDSRMKKHLGPILIALYLKNANMHLTPPLVEYEDID